MNAVEIRSIKAFLKKSLDAFERLEGVEGPEQGLVAPTAEQAERQGAAEERSRGRGRVAPVEAEAVFVGKVNELRSLAAMLRTGEAMNRPTSNTILLADALRAQAAVVESFVEFLQRLLPEPESGADAPASPRSLETPTEAQP